VAASPAPEPSPDLAAGAWRLIMNLVMTHKQHIPAIAASFHLNPGAMNALLQLDADNPRTMGSLAESFKCDASHVTWLVDRLEEHGLAQRLSHPTDRRVRMVALTKKGARMRTQVEAKLFEAPKALRDLAPEDLSKLCTILEKIAPDGCAWS
jgi:DNA-binding MarR family transcriptional regulator